MAVGSVANIEGPGRTETTNVAHVNNCIHIKPERVWEIILDKKRTELRMASWKHFLRWSLLARDKHSHLRETS